MEPERLRNLVEAYAAAWARNDRAGWLATFAADATQEDPIGEGVRRGREAIGGFWDRAMEGRDSLEIRPRAIHITGGEAAMEWRITTRMGGEWTVFDGVDVFTFTDEPLIATVRAYGDRATFRVIGDNTALAGPGWDVAPFTAGDLAGVLSLCEAEGWPSLPDDPARALRLLTAPGVTSVVARSPEGRILGFAQLFSDRELQAFLATLAVDAAWRGRGVGRALVEDALRRGGGDRIDLLSEDAAAAFYESFPHRRKPGYRLYPFFRD
jgi:uncharacterized protein (TIGR02246 family)